MRKGAGAADLLVDYTDNRIALSTAPEDRQQLLARNDRLLTDIWAAVLAATESARDKSVSSPLSPSNSVHVRIHTCGKSRCGTVVWANDKAKTVSARGGTRNLVGTELFREFREVSPKVWKGRVFVPDLNKVLTGTGTVKDQNVVVARGCLIGNIGCKSQTWTRVR